MMFIHDFVDMHEFIHAFIYDYIYNHDCMHDFIHDFAYAEIFVHMDVEFANFRQMLFLMNLRNCTIVFWKLSFFVFYRFPSNSHMACSKIFLFHILNFIF